jgi:ubiquitin carboxyl-terminal hydrolase L3
MTEQNWIPIESNPEVMNKFLSSVGVSSQWSIVDVIGLDEELLAFIPRPIVSLLLLFPTNDDKIDSAEDNNCIESCDQNKSEVYFMRQTIGNACGTIALIHAIANNMDCIEFSPNSSLKSFIDLSKSLKPCEKAKLLETNKDICNAHQMCAQEGQTSAPVLNRDVNHHFIAFVEKCGFLYQLDGRKEFPINHGKTTKDNFVSDAAKICQQFMSKDPNNLNFTVVALVKDNQNFD